MNLKRRFKSVNIRKRLVKRLHKLIETLKFDFNLDDSNIKLAKSLHKLLTQSLLCEGRLCELLEKFFNMDINKKELEEIYTLSIASNKLFKVIDREELIDIIKYVCVVDEKANLNWLDTSNISDMWGVFLDSKFNGDISEWDVSNVNDMSLMFQNSEFNGDISKWDVSNVEDASRMFQDSKFNRDISNWNLIHINDCNNVFKNCPIIFMYKPRRLNRFKFIKK